MKNMKIKLEKNGGSYGLPSVKINGKIYGPADRTPSGLTAAAIVADWATSASAADYAEARRWLAQWHEGPQLKGAQQAAAGSQGGKAKTAAKSTAAKANGAKGGRPVNVETLLKSWAKADALLNATGDERFDLMVEAEDALSLEAAADWQTLCDRYDTTRSDGRRNRPLVVEDFLKLPACHRAEFAGLVWVRDSVLQKMLEKYS